MEAGPAGRRAGRAALVPGRRLPALGRQRPGLARSSDRADGAACPVDRLQEVVYGSDGTAVPRWNFQGMRGRRSWRSAPSRSRRGLPLSEAPGRAADRAGGGQDAQVGAGVQEGAVEVADHGRAHRMPPVLALDDGAQAGADQVRSTPGRGWRDGGGRGSRGDERAEQHAGQKGRQVGGPGPSSHSWVRNGNPLLADVSCSGRT